MALERTRATELDLGRLLRGIHEGTVVLPDFQRDFDWNDSDVRALLATVLSGWPIGSLLLMQGPPSFFRVRAFEDAPEPEDPEYIVLDGQQRLTALYQSMYNRGDYVYALALSALDTDSLEVDEIEESLVAVKRHQWDTGMPSPEDQLGRSYIPVFALKSAADFFVWRDEATSPGTVQEGQRDNLTHLYRQFLSGLHDYDIPGIIVDNEIRPAAIARIFERVNRTGMRLGTFDLMVATTYAPNFNLRVEWESARDRFPRLSAFLGEDGFAEDGLPILNVLALRYKEDVRQKAVLSLSGTLVHDGWEDAARHMDRALQFASEHLGIWTPDWVPYRNVLTLLAAMSYEGPLEDEKDSLNEWYWTTVFGRRYDVASNTRVVADYEKLRAGEWEPSPITFVLDDVLEASKKTQGAFHRAVLTALAVRGPMDPLNGQVLTPSGLENGKLPQISAVSLAKRDRSEERAVPLHLRSLSFVLALADNSRAVAGHELSELHREALETQLVGPEMMPSDSPESFLEGRVGRLADWLENQVGLRVQVVEEASFQ